MLVSRTAAKADRKGESYEEHNSDCSCNVWNVDGGNRFSCEYEGAMRSVRGPMTSNTATALLLRSAP